MEHSVELTIGNRMGFHVRPVQRFAEMARVFKADVEVCLRGRCVPGKSVMNLMSLGGRCGDPIVINARGEDAMQCVGVLKFLVESHFFVEDEPNSQNHPQRHITRLVSVASCFRSDIEVKLDGHEADAKQEEALADLQLTPNCRPQLHVRGEDAEQARAIVENLVSHYFYVEDEMVRSTKG